jgi:probable rRNA maturation factor
MAIDVTDAPLEPEEPPSPLAQALVVEIENRQFTLDMTAVDSAAASWEQRLYGLALHILNSEGVSFGELSIALVDDREIRVLNNQYLQHDYATDTLSFLLDEDEEAVVGQVVVSVETASRSVSSEQRRNPTYGLADEIALYVAHATLHLVGYDDHHPVDRSEMRTAEVRYLTESGFVPPVSRDDSTLEKLG